MRALKFLSFLPILILLPLLFYIFSLSLLQAIQGSQTSVGSISTFAVPTDPISNAIITISNTLLDEGQPLTIIAQVSGGVSPYTYNFILSQSGTPSNIITYSGSASNALTSNSFVWTTNAIGTFVANVIITDSANVPETTNSVYSVPFSVSAYPIATNLTPSNTILDSGQYVTYNVIINGGTLPITANLVYVAGPSNTVINGNVPGNVLQRVTLPIGSAEPNIITFNSFELTTPGSYTFNVIAVDSANTPVTFNAVANTITVNPTTPATSTSTTTSTTSSTTTTSSSTTTIPQITLGLSIVPSGVGSIIFSGNTYQNGTISVSQGNYSIEAVPANGFQFLSWQSSGGVSLQSNTYATNVTVNSSGSITALFIPIITLARSGNYIGGNVFAINKHAKIRLYGTNTLHSIDITFNTNIRPFAMNVVISNPTNSNFYNFYKIINISESNPVIDNNISQVVYNFSVPVSFVQEHRISNGNIRLFKQVNNAFVPLPTTYTGTNGTYYFYSAISNSLSTYVISYASGNTVGTSTPLSLSMPSGYPTYFFAYGGLSGKAGTASGSAFSDNWTTITNHTSVFSAKAKAQYNMTNIGYTTIPTGTVSGGTAPINVSLVGLALYGGYADGKVFSSSTSAKSNTLSFTVTTNNSFVALLYASGGAAFSAKPTTNAPGNILLQNVAKGGTSAAIIVVNSLAPGTYTASVSTSKTASISIVAFVLPPYNISLTFNDLPCNGTIIANGTTEINGNTVIFHHYVFNMPVNAIVPAGFTFSGWNATYGLSIANTLSQNSLLTANRSGVLTAVSLSNPVVVVPGAPYQDLGYAVYGKASHQTHNILKVGGYYYYFYEDANSLIAYANSTDGSVWHQVGEIEKVPINNTKRTAPLDAFTDGNTVYIIYRTQINNQTLRAGTATNGIITFRSPIVLDTLGGWAGFSGTAISSGVAALYITGLSNGTDYINPVNLTQDSGTTWTNPKTIGPSSTLYANPLWATQAAPLPNTINGMVLTTEYYSASAFNYTVYNGVSWTIGNIGNKVADAYNVGFAEFTAGNIVYFAAPMPNVSYPAYLYEYNALSSTWNSGTEIAPSPVYWVRLGGLSNKELILLYSNSTNELYYRIMSLSTGRWSTPFLVTNQQIIQSRATLQYGMAYGVMTGAFMNATNTLFFFKIPLAGPIPVTFNDSPTSGNIIVNGVQEASGNVVNACEGGITFTINALAPSGYKFNYWQVSNATNLSIANTLSANTILTVYGSGVVTANYTLATLTTKFVETGLPSGTKWNVTYDNILNSSTTNTILFATAPGNYLFSVPVQTVNGIAYEPSPKSGYLVAGNTTTITFKPFSVSISPPSNAVVDAGQYETFTATVYNGTSPYTYNILVVNSITPSVIAHNDLVSGSSATTLTYTFQTTSADVSNSPEEANVVVTDSFPATVNSVYSSTFTINPAMTTPSISPTSPATYSPGSTVTFSTSFTGGTPPYTYNWLVVNSITGVLLANALYTGVSATSNSFAWTIPSADNGNTVVANVIVTDSASKPVTVNSTKSAVITISSVTCTISLSSSAINFGSIIPSTSIATNNAISDSNTGTANAYMYVYGGNWIFSSNTAISFYVANTVWSSIANTAYSSATRLSNLATNTSILVPAGASNTIYFGLAVPGGAKAGAYTQNIIIANQC